MSKQKLEWRDKVSCNPVIQELQKYVKEECRLYTVLLAGGAVVDILDGRTPKDYDIIGAPGALGSRLLAEGYEFLGDTSKASTYLKGTTIIQLLKVNSINDFEFTISQTSVNLRTLDLKINRDHYNSKELVPVKFTGQQGYSALARIPHWMKKGYSIKEVTYHSLLRNVVKSEERYPQFSMSS
jgi:hypothetical protein